MRDVENDLDVGMVCEDGRQRRRRQRLVAERRVERRRDEGQWRLQFGVLLRHVLTALGRNVASGTAFRIGMGWRFAV